VLPALLQLCLQLFCRREEIGLYKVNLLALVSMLSHKEWKEWGKEDEQVRNKQCHMKLLGRSNRKGGLLNKQPGDRSAANEASKVTRSRAAPPFRCIRVPSCR
jgi:hypothetical protein